MRESVFDTITVVVSDDWEGLYYNGNLIDEGHELWEGEHPMKYAFRMFTEFSELSLHGLLDLEVRRVTDEFYKTYLAVHGNYPKKLLDVELKP